MHSATNYQLWLASGIHELDDGPQIISWECCTLGTNFWCGKVMWCGRRMLWVAFMGGWELWGCFSCARSSGYSFSRAIGAICGGGSMEEGEEEGIKAPLLDAQNRVEEGLLEVRASMSTMDPNEHQLGETQHFSLHFGFQKFQISDVIKKIRYPLRLKL